MSEYHQILGVTTNATLDQIKKAYRSKAKKLHPDINKSENAHDEFILLNEAYEYLLNTSGTHFNRFKRAQEQAQKQAAYHKAWEKQERENAKKRAREYAQMKYDEYLKSDIYRTTEAINAALDIFVTAIVLLFIIGLPVLTYIEHGPISLILSALIILPTSPIWFRFLVRTFHSLNFHSLLSLNKMSMQNRIRYIVILSFFNFFIFLKVTLCTFIELRWIFTLYISLYLVTSIFTWNSKNNNKKHFIRIGFAPFALSLLFTINFVFSYNKKTETYWYTYNTKSAPVCKVITLEHNTYDNFTGVRLFIIEDRVKRHSKISYQIKEGIFGFRVAHKRTIH
ncbi:J domain-containing protein [Plebeiibacterium marinum]|uniref:DnaJ domain-containing protein n=1 Tax=Plebeiibacterium marinum TaxID=2992111 RepID=A0AAE3SJN5_9BACT|nr:DnaJ domain-containing protein [Plebeiobacterium marinum]MCW3805925.1 DnaJ domain-containing protein [Plebeiobacterium marinum]